jgi:hypothetical protein
MGEEKATENLRRGDLSDLSTPAGGQERIVLHRILAGPLDVEVVSLADQGEAVRK